MESKRYTRYKWIGLIGFALMYNLVYVSRFNVNNLMGEMSGDLNVTEYQQGLISMSVFLSYAAGSFVNGYLVDRYGAKKMILSGAVLSVGLNLAVIFQDHWMGVLCLWLANGYFQSMIWIGGIAFVANWWQEGKRGMGIGIVNFSSGMSHVTTYLFPAALGSLWPGMSWELNLAIPTGVFLLLAVIFFLTSAERPEDIGEEPYLIKNYRHRVREEHLKEIKRDDQRPFRWLLQKKRFWWWCAIAMLSSICRYGLLNWIPLYFEEGLVSETFSNLMLPVGMAFGTLIITWVAGTKLFDNQGIIVTAMAALCGMLVVIFPMVQEEVAILTGIFFTGFVLYGINGILWLYAIEQGGRVFAGSAAGILNGFAYLGAFLENILFRTVLNVFSGNMAVFLVMEVFCICMVVCGMVVCKKNTVVIPEVRE